MINTLNARLMFPLALFLAKADKARAALEMIVTSPILYFVLTGSRLFGFGTDPNTTRDYDFIAFDGDGMLRGELCMRGFKPLNNMSTEYRWARECRPHVTVYRLSGTIRIDVQVYSDYDRYQEKLWANEQIYLMCDRFSTIRSQSQQEWTQRLKAARKELDAGKKLLFTRFEEVVP